MEGLIPIFIEEKDREDFINSLESKYSTFKEWNWDIIQSKNTLELKLGWYIYKNWEKVTDWSNYRVTLHKKDYGKKWDITRTKSRVIRNFHKLMNENITQIESIKVTYDISDGDVSVECNNDGNWSFLNYEQVMDLGLYIEEQLNK